MCAQDPQFKRNANAWILRLPKGHRLRLDGAQVHPGTTCKGHRQTPQIMRARTRVCVCVCVNVGAVRPQPISAHLASAALARLSPPSPWLQCRGATMATETGLPRSCAHPLLGLSMSLCLSPIDSLGSAPGPRVQQLARSQTCDGAPIGLAFHSSILNTARPRLLSTARPHSCRHTFN